MSGALIVEAKLRPSEIALARVGRFLHGPWIRAWIFGSAAIALAWALARARGHALASELMLPLLLVAMAAPILVVFAGIHARSSQAAIEDGVRFAIDETTVRVEVAGTTHEHRWGDVDDAFALGNVVVLVVRGSIYALPVRALETRARLEALRGFLRAWSKARTASPSVGR